MHSKRPIFDQDSYIAVREFFHIAYWVAHTYGRGEKPSPGVSFDVALIPKVSALPKQTLEELHAEALPELVAACRVVPAELGESIGDLQALAAAMETPV